MVVDNDSILISRDKVEIPLHKKSLNRICSLQKGLYHLVVYLGVILQGERFKEFCQNGEVAGAV